MARSAIAVSLLCAWLGAVSHFRHQQPKLSRDFPAQKKICTWIFMLRKFYVFRTVGSVQCRIELSSSSSISSVVVLRALAQLAAAARAPWTDPGRTFLIKPTLNSSLWILYLPFSYACCRSAKLQRNCQTVNGSPTFRRSPPVRTEFRHQRCSLTELHALFCVALGFLRNLSRASDQPHFPFTDHDMSLMISAFSSDLGHQPHLLVLAIFPIWQHVYSAWPAIASSLTLMVDD